MTDQTRARRASLPGYACLAALALAAMALCALFCARPARAAEWMTPYLEQVQEWGVMRGDASGNLHEDRNINRAEFVTLVNRAFGYKDVGPNTFADVNPNDWFAEDISIAHQAGYFNGTSPTTADPYALVTREQAAVLLGRCLRFQGVTGAANSTFTDMEEIGGWSRGLVQEAAELGIIQGYSDGSFRPNLPITRGQMACFLVRALGTLVQEPGEQTSGGVYGNLTITTPGVKLKDTVVTGNLYLTGGVGLGNVELENVEVLGKIVVCGGGEAEGGKHSVILRNVTAGGLELDSLTEQFFSLEAEGLTNIDSVTVRSSAYIEDRTEDGLGLQTIRLDGADGSQFQLAGNLKRVVDLTPNSRLQIAQGVADVVTMDEKAEGASLVIDNLASIRELNLDRGVQVTGDGAISHLNVNAPGSTVSMLPDTIYVRPGITANINKQNMDNKAASESSEDPRILAGYPVARNIAATSANAIFRTNKPGTIRWAVTALMDGSVGETELMEPGSYPKIVRSGTINATAANTDFTARLTGLTKEGSYYISALLEDARGRRSPVKVAVFSTPDDSAPNFATGYPQTPILTVDADNEQVAQIMVMATKSCQMYYALLPQGSAAPTAADFRAAALPGNLGSGMVELKKNTPFLLSRINTSHLQENTTYDLYLWLNDADNGKSSAVRRVQITTKDMTPPTIQSLTVRSFAARQVVMSFALDEPGSLYWAVVKHGDGFYAPGVDKTNPNRNAKIQIENGVAYGGTLIRKGGPVRAARAGTDYSFTISGLEPQTAYDLYFVAKDLAGNYCEYSKSLLPPMEIHTLDGEKPTVRREFENDASPEDRPHTVTHPNTDIYIIFSEPVTGYQGKGSSRVPDDFMEAYQKVQNASSADRPAREREFAEMLQRHITLYDTRTKKPVSVRSAENESTIGSNWVLDFRKAIVDTDSPDNEMTITFPYDPDPAKSAVNLSSGGTYYFVVKDIMDTSPNQNLMDQAKDGFKTPNFTTTVAKVELDDNLTNTKAISRSELADPSEFPSDNNIKDGKFQVNWSFTMDPDATNQAADDMGWDLLIWSDHKIDFDLYTRSRPEGSAGTTGWSLWKKIGGTASIDKAAGTDLVYISLTRSENLNNSEDYPSLRSLDQDTQYEYAVHLASVNNNDDPDSWIESIQMRATVTAGRARAMDLSSPVFQGDMKSLEDGVKDGVMIISEATENNVDVPHLNSSISPPELSGPKLETGYPQIKSGSTVAEITAMLDRDGTVYCMALPMTPTAGTPITGTNYEVPRIVALKSSPSAVVKPAIEDIPANGSDSRNSANPMLRLPTGSSVAEKSELKGTRWNSKSFKQGQADVVTLTDLAPNTTYMLLISTLGLTRYSEVSCYQFTTGQVSAPNLELQAGDLTAQARTKEPARGRGILIVDGSLPELLRPFSTAAGTATTDAYANNPGLSRPDGKYSVLDALINEYGVRNPETNPVLGSVFDQYATQGAKDDIYSIIDNRTISSTSVVQRVPSFTTPGGINWTNMPDALKMTSGWYTFLAYAESPLGSAPSFRAIRPLEASDKQWPTVNPNSDITVSFQQLDPNNPSRGYRGRVTITFSENIYFLDQSSGSQQQVPVTSTPFASPGWVTRFQINGDKPMGWQIYTENGTPSYTRQVSYETDKVIAGDYTFSIKQGLCDQWGNMPGSGKIGFQVTVRIAGNNTDGYTYSLAGIPDVWNSTRTQSRPTN